MSKKILYFRRANLTTVKIFTIILKCIISAPLHIIHHSTLFNCKNMHRALVIINCHRKSMMYYNFDRLTYVTKFAFRAFFYYWGGTYVTRYCGHFWPIVQPQMIAEGDCGVIGGMRIGRGNRSTRRKPAPAPFCAPQIPLDQTRARTRAAAVGSQRLTA
jgi:hypothetical protein